MTADQMLKMSTGFILWGGENYIADSIAKVLLIWLLLLAGTGTLFYLSRRLHQHYAALAAPPPSTPSPSGWRWLPMSLLFALALAIRLFYLGLEPLDSQELSYYIKATASNNILMVIFAPFMASPHPPLFTLLMFLWRLFNDSLFYLRLPAAICGALTAPLLYAWISRRTNHFIAAATGLMLAVSALHTYYSQTIMPYSLLNLLIVAAYYLHHRVLDEPDRHYRNIAYSVVLAAGLLCHFSYFAFIFPLILETLWTFYRSAKTPGDWRRLFKFAHVLTAAVLAFIALSIGLVIYFVAGLKVIMPIVKGMDLYFPYASVGEGLLHFVKELLHFFEYGFGCTFGSRAVVWRDLLYAPFALLGLLWWHRSHRGLLWHVQLPVLAGLGFFVANGLLTVVQNHFFYFAMRRFMPLLPFLYFLLAYGLWIPTQLPVIRARRVFTYALAGSVLLSVISWQSLDLTQSLLTMERSDTDNAVAYLKRNLEDGDAGAVGPYAFFESMFNYAFRRHQRDWVMTLGPGRWRRHSTWKDSQAVSAHLLYPLHNVYLPWNEVLANVYLKRIWLMTVEETPYGWRELLGSGTITPEPLYRAGCTLTDQVNFQLVTISRFTPPPHRHWVDSIIFGANDFAQARGFLPSEQVRTVKRLIVHDASVKFAEAETIAALTLDIEKFKFSRQLELILELSTSQGHSTLTMHTQPGTAHLHIPIHNLPAAPGDELTVSFKFDEENRDLFPDCLTDEGFVCGLYLYKMEVERKDKPAASK